MTDQELNEAVARKLHGDEWRMWSAEDYCHSISAAWEIVEFLKKDWNIHIFGGFDGKFWHCDIYDHPAIGKVHISESADIAPMAICQAFLKLP